MFKNRKMNTSMAFNEINESFVVEDLNESAVCCVVTCFTHQHSRHLCHDHHHITMTVVILITTKSESPLQWPKSSF
jgi:hypothetical protein